MKPSGSLNDIAGSVKVYLHKKQQQKSLVEEVLEYVLWLPFAYGAHRLGFTKLSFLFGTWFVLGVLCVLYMRQRVVQLSWQQALLLTGGLMAFFVRELALPANAFYSFFSRYVLLATLVTVVFLRLLPARLSEELPDILFRLGMINKAPRKDARAD